MSGAVVAIACALCGAALRSAGAAAAPAHRSITSGRAHVLKDLWQVARSRPGLLALLICFCRSALEPRRISGRRWRTTGMRRRNSRARHRRPGRHRFDGGCLAGGYLGDHMDRKSRVHALRCDARRCAPWRWRSRPGPSRCTSCSHWRTPIIRDSPTPRFSAVVLEAIGLGAAATKYNVFASLSNMPIAYMTLRGGWAHGRWSVGGMLVGRGNWRRMRPV